MLKNLLKRKRNLQWRITLLLRLQEVYGLGDEAIQFHLRECTANYLKVKTEIAEFQKNKTNCQRTVENNFSISN